jgi:hypothetical protein
MVAVRNMAAAAGTSTDTVLPIVTRNKHRPGRFQSRRRPVSGDGSGTGITGFAPAFEHKNFGSMYRRGRSPYWVKVKNPKAPAVKRGCAALGEKGQGRLIICRAESNPPRPIRPRRSERRLRHNRERSHLPHPPITHVLHAASSGYCAKTHDLICDLNHKPNR